MNKRPLLVTLISWLFILAGAVGLAYHGTEFAKGIRYELILVLLLRLLAIIAGLFMLRGKNWARWVLIGWLLYHVILSAFHSQSELIMHCLLLIVIGYFLFRAKASTYFRASRGTSQMK